MGLLVAKNIREQRSSDYSVKISIMLILPTLFYCHREQNIVLDKEGSSL